MVRLRESSFRRGLSLEEPHGLSRGTKPLGGVREVILASAHSESHLCHRGEHRTGTSNPKRSSARAERPVASGTLSLRTSGSRPAASST